MGQDLAHTMQRSTIEDIILFMKTSLADSITINTIRNQQYTSDQRISQIHRFFSERLSQPPKDQ